MKIQKIVFAVVVACLVLIGCKSEDKKKEVKKETIAANMQKVSLHVTGMTCEIGCAKIIQSKLSKKEGIASAKVVFKDSLATVDYDANKISKKEIVAFVDGIAGGDLYKASETTKKTCDADCKKACCVKSEAEKKTCKEDCKMECCKDKEA